MPEAPEVEAIARALRPLVMGRTIRAFRVIHPIATKPQSPAALARILRGNKILRVDRLGKYLLLHLSHGVLVFHFKFDGRLLWFDRQHPRSVHVDILFTLDRGILGFVDPRHLGRAAWYASPESSNSLRSLGVDVFSTDFTANALAEILRSSSRPVKLVLLDQAKIAGLGNIYATEALWHARFNPWRLARRATPAESRRLHISVVRVARRALECCSHPPPEFRNSGWWFADLGKILRAYDLEGKPCRRCGTQIRRIQLGGRSTYFCPRCQR
jgi:formamidopyrimidine-DNA glycosylase